jgi:hypothetical protein
MNARAVSVLSENHACRLEGGADGSKIVGCWNSSALLKVPDRTLAKVRASAEFGLRPIQKAAGRARLFGLKCHRFAFTINDFR